jgi:hypothetical protein
MADAPWPYGEPARESDKEAAPRWECIDGTCECHPVESEDDLVPHHVTLFDADAVRMPGARCRVWRGATLVNRGQPYADGNGGVELELTRRDRTLLVEWAPSDVPADPNLPYRISYHVDLGRELEDGVARRLHNIGFCLAPSLEDNVRAFQRTYGPPGAPVTGRPEDIDAQLAAYHDAALLPPLVHDGALPPPAPGSATPGEAGSAREAVMRIPFEIGIEIGDHVRWTESDPLVIVDALGEKVLEQPLGSGKAEGGLRVIPFSEYRKNQRYTVKVRFGEYAYVLYEGLDIYDYVHPATISPEPGRPAQAYIRDTT